MPVRQIDNPLGAFGQTATAGVQLVLTAKNNSAGTLRAGDVVVLDVTTTLATTTTTASDNAACGVVGSLSGALDSGDTYVVGVGMPVVIYGPARINIAANTVAAKANLASSTAAKVAATAAAAASVAALQALIGSFIAVALEADSAKDVNNTIRCFITKG